MLIPVFIANITILFLCVCFSYLLSCVIVHYRKKSEIRKQIRERDVFVSIESIKKDKRIGEKLAFSFIFLIADCSIVFAFTHDTMAEVIYVTENNLVEDFHKYNVIGTYTAMDGKQIRCFDGKTWVINNSNVLLLYKQTFYYALTHRKHMEGETQTIAIGESASFDHKIDYIFEDLPETKYAKTKKDHISIYSLQTYTYERSIN